ncbi:MAG: radical SAM protein [Ruminococcus sp.]|nr:radical SAM protein [Ruminococcus sp.]
MKNKRKEVTTTENYTYRKEGRPPALMYVVHEIDSIFAAALIARYSDYSFRIVFTNRHDLNYDITGDPGLIEQCGKVFIIGPALNEYSILYLERFSKETVYIGSTNRLRDFMPELYTENKVCRGNSVYYLENDCITGRIAAHYSYSDDIVQRIYQYTTKYIKDDLYDAMVFEYLNFGYSSSQLFEMFSDYIGKPFTLGEEFAEEFERALARNQAVLDKAVIRNTGGIRTAFIRGGCPCTLVLNQALRTLECDAAVNVCLHRQHFTFFTSSPEICAEMYDKYISHFIYSGGGTYSCGACFGADYTFEEFISAFTEHRNINGFSRERLLSYDVFDPRDYQWLEFENYALYRNFNFTIFLDEYCNADCRFCIEQIKTENNGRINKVGKIEDKETYLRRLDFIAGKIRPYNPSISITGGEPLLSPCFREAMRILAKYKFRKIVITTNGTNIDRYTDDIIAAGISHVNFSRPSYDMDVCQKIMRFREQHPSIDTLISAIAKLEENGVRTRFNCIVSREGIGTLPEMKKYLSFVRSAGCRHVVFRELMSFNENESKNAEKMAYAAENRVLMNDLWAEMDGDKNFIPFSNIRGHYYYIEIYKYHDMTVVSERANLKYLEKYRRENLHYIYEMVFHPNGNLCAGWNETEDILDSFTDWQAAGKEPGNE